MTITASRLAASEVAQFEALYWTFLVEEGVDLSNPTALMRQRRAMLDRYLDPGHQVFTAYEDDAMIGFICLTDGPVVGHNGDAVSVTGCYVSPDKRDTGTFETLLSRAREFAKAQGRSRIEAHMKRDLDGALVKYGFRRKATIYEADL